MNLFIVLVFALFSGPLFADSEAGFIDGGSDNILATKDAFTISINDQVTGGCLPNPDRLKDKVEIVLRQNGFNIDSEVTLFSTDIKMYAIGFDINQGQTVLGCAVYLGMDIQYLAPVVVPWSEGRKTAVVISVEIAGGLVAVSKDKMQRVLEEKATDYANDLYLRISRARDYVAKKNPSILENWKKAKK